MRRVQIGPLADTGIPVGAMRNLTEDEVKRLKTGNFEKHAPKTIRVGKPGGPTRRDEGERKRTSTAKSSPRKRGPR